MLSYGQGILTPSTLISFSEKQGLYVLSKSCTRFMLHSQSSTIGCWLVPEYTTWSRRSYQGQFWDVTLPSSAHRLLRRHGRRKKEIADCVRSSFASQITLLGGLGLNFTSKPSPDFALSFWPDRMCHPQRYKLAAF